MKSHSTNTQNILKSVTMLGAVTATGAVMTTTAHADTTNNAQNQAQATSAQDQLANLKQSQTQTENQLAQKNQQAYADAQAEKQPEIDKLQNKLKNQQASQASADAQKVANKTNELNNKYQSKIDAENTAYTNAKSTQEAVNSQAEQKQAQENDAALKDASTHIITPEQKAQDQETAKIEYQEQSRQMEGQKASAVKNAKASHDKTVDDLNAQINAKQSQASKNHDAALKNATQAVTDTTAAAQKTVQNESQAQDALNRAQSSYDAAKNALDKASQNANDYNVTAKNTYKPTLSPEAVKYLDNPAATNYHFPGNTYYINGEYNIDRSSNRPADYLSDHTTYTGYTANALSQLTANILNSLRKSAGTNRVYANEYYTKLAEELTQEYNASNPGELNHNQTLLQKFADEHNIRIFENLEMDDPIDTNDLSNNKGLFYFKNKITAPPYLIAHLINNDNMSHEQHAQLLTGLGIGRINPSQETQYVAFNQDKYGVAHIYLFEVPNENVNHDNDLPLADTPAKNYSSNTSAEQKAFDEASAKLDAAKTAYNQAHTAKVNANNAATVAQENLAKVKAGQVVESPEVTQLKNQLQTENNNYTAKLQQIDQQYKAQAQKLADQYQQKLDAINAKPTSTDALKKQLDAKLDAVKKAGQDALAKLAKKHQDKLNAIQAEIQGELAKYKQELANKHVEENKPLVDQITKLQLELSTKKAELDKQLADLKAKNAAEYQALADKLAPKQSANAAVKGNRDSYVTSNGMTIELKGGNEAASHKQTQVLPQTGNNNSSAIVALGVLGSMFGLRLAARKRY